MCGASFYPRAPPFCEHRSIVYNVSNILRAESLWLLSHRDVFNDLIQHPMGISPDFRLNVVLERINSSRIVSIDPKSHILFVRAVFIRYF